MARPFSATDAKRIIERHQNIIEKLNNAVSSVEKYRTKAKEASDALVAQEVLKVLADIPIEEINRDKRGIRVKALRDYGYRTIADISTASVYSIASVHGISEDAAYSIKSIVNDIVSKARQGVKIRLSTDNRSKEATALVLALSQYRRSQKVADECRQLLNKNKQTIAYALEDLNSSAGTLKWLLSSKTKKQKAVEAYNSLIGLIDGDYGSEAETQISNADVIDRSSNSDAWQDFATNSVRFFNDLEDINPGVLGNENLTDQAQAIYQQHFVTKANPDWPLGHLSDLINVKYGKDHKKLADGAYPVYGSGGIMRYVEHPLYEKESVLIPRKGTLNNVMYVNQPFWSVDTMFYTEMKQANVAKFVYHYVKSKDLASMNAGSAVPSMTTAILNAMELRIPSEEALFQFENSVAPMYEMIKKNEDQSRKLAQLRDVLLSKLMSGEIDVSNLDL